MGAAGVARRRAPFWLGLVLTATAIVWPASAAADTSSCTYLPASRTVAVNITDSGFNDQQGVAVDGSKIRHYNDGLVTDCGAATVQNTDSILINEVAPSTTSSVSAVAYMLPGSSFAPGAVNEPGSSDEIELVVDLGDGRDDFGITSYGQSRSFRIGRTATSRLVNLNADETDGIDADVIMHGVDRLSVAVDRKSPRSDIRATGGAGTGGKPIDLPLVLYGGIGGDRLVGGLRADTIWGRRGRDRILGGRGRDTIWAGGGGDRVRGQRGRDVLRGMRGNDLLNGGPHRDRCIGGPGRDVLIACERKR